MRCLHCGREIKHLNKNPKYCSQACCKLQQFGTPQQRFWRQVTKGDGCWTWNGLLDRDGYGHFYLLIGNQREQRAARAVWIFVNGAIPSGLHVLHKCDNRMCVNPDHLFLGTNRDNHDDMCRKNRDRHLAGEAHPNRKLTAKLVAAMRAEWVADKSRGSQARIAKKYGLDRRHLHKILKAILWKERSAALADLVTS